MTPEQFIAAKAARAVSELYGAEVDPATLQVQVTRKEFEGDYTLVVFPLLRISHAAPDATGAAIGGWLVDKCPEISAFNSVKGFLNLSLSNLYWREALESLVAAGKDYFSLPSTGKKIMVEFSSPNTNKPLHLGHIRNNLLGDSVSRLLAAAGNEVIKATLVNDRGVHICKSMYAWQQRFGGATPESTGKKGDHLVGDCYVEFSKMEKEDPSVIDRVHEMLVKWEQGDPEVRALWEKMNGWVFDGFNQTYKALGISFDRTYYEHDRKLLLRSDGTSVYMTQDLGTAERRFAEYNLDSHVYVVGDEQNYHFQVLKLVLAKLGFDWAERIYHLSYGMVELPEVKMKSREGTVVDADDLIEDMYREAKATSEESGKLADIPEADKEKLYHMIGLGALKYFILKVDPKKKMLFNPKESIDFNGNTGPFIQYTHARIRSILRKADEAGYVRELADVELSPKEIRIVQQLNLYRQKLAEAAASFSPAVMANYAYDLAKEFNQYYHDTQILRESDVKLRDSRLVLIDAVSQVLANSMALLGIELPERM